MTDPSRETTPGQTVGPFFHDALPFPRGEQLVPPGTSGAVQLHGHVYDGAGDPLPDALLEIRQADADGSVPRVEGSLRRSGGFTGWGRCATDAEGRYRFTTVEPAGVDGGPAFFAVTVFARGLLDRLFTRAYLPGQQDDFLDRAVRARARHPGGGPGGRRLATLRRPAPGRGRDCVPDIPEAPMRTG